MHAGIKIHQVIDKHVVVQFINALHQGLKGIYGVVADVVVGDLLKAERKASDKQIVSLLYFPVAVLYEI